MSRAYLSLGANMGDRKDSLDEAHRRLNDSPGISVIKVSAYYETDPVGGPPQEKFLNAAMEIETTLSPEALLKRCLEVEAAMGRRRGVHWGPRVIDIDILIYDGQVIDSPTLKVPHPMMHLRRFVLEPLVELAPGLLHPPSGRTVSQLLSDLPETSSEESGNETKASRTD